METKRPKHILICEINSLEADKKGIRKEVRELNRELDQLK